MKQREAEELVISLIEILSEELSDTREQKAVFARLIDILIDDFEIDQLTECLGESTIFDTEYKKYMKKMNVDTEDETEELDFDDE